MTRKGIDPFLIFLGIGSATPLIILVCNTLDNPKQFRIPCSPDCPMNGEKGCRTSKCIMRALKLDQEPVKEGEKEVEA